MVESRFEAESSTFFLKVEETPELWPEGSARAGTPVTCHDPVEPMQWRHLNVFNKECVIVFALPRGRRGDDSKVYRVTPPWEGRSKHFTQEFEAFALTLMREMLVKRAGQILGESDTGEQGQEQGQGTISEFDPTVLQPSLTHASAGPHRV